MKELRSPGRDDSRDKDFLIAGSLVFLALSVYLLTYSGLFRSIDELTMYAQAEGLGQGLGAEAPQFQFAEYHHRFRARFEPFQAMLLTPFYFLGLHLPGVGTVQTVFLLNPLLSAAAVGFIWLTLRALGLSTRAAILGSISFAFATIVWPYTRTLFREPMATFTLAWALYFFVRYQKHRALRDAVFCLIPLLLSVAARSETILSLAAFGVGVLFIDRSRIRLLAPIVLLVFALGGLVLLWNWGYRFTAPVSVEDPSLVLRVFSRQFNPEVIASRLLALSVFPGKGLFAYAPLLALAPLGAAKLWPKSPRLVVLLAAISIGYLLLYSMYFDWRGGVAWGPRLLVPLAVPLTLLVSPLFASRGFALGLTMGVTILSTAIQFVAATADWTIYYDKLIRNFAGRLSGQVFLRPTVEWSPVLGQFQIWQPGNLDLVWLRSSAAGQPPSLESGILAVALLLIGLSSAILYLALSGRLSVSARRVLVLEGIAFAAGIFFFLRGVYQVDAAYWDTDTASLRQIAQTTNNFESGRLLVVSVSNQFHYNTFMNFLKRGFVHYWLSPLQEELDFLQEPATNVQRILLITDSIPPNSPESYAERWLNQEAFRYHGGWVGQYFLFQYAPPQTLPIRRTGPWAWPGITLLEVGLGAEGVRAGEAIPLEFTFRAEEGLNRDYSFFVHLIREDGSLLDGEDAPPGYGANPTSSWKVGEIMKDRRALLVPPDLEEGEYLIEVGFTVEGERVLPDTGEGITSRGTVLVSRIYVTGTR